MYITAKDQVHNETTVIQQEWAKAYHLPNLGRSIPAMLQVLHERMGIAGRYGNKHFEFLVRILNNLQDDERVAMGTKTEANPMLYGMMWKAFEKLLPDWQKLREREIQMEIDEERNRAMWESDRGWGHENSGALDD
jgi:hypothetical protein